MICSSSSAFSECTPCRWFVVFEGSEKLLPLVFNVVLLALAFLPAFFDIYDDPSYRCPQFACNGLGKLLKILILVGRYLVIAMIYRDLISGVYGEIFIVHLFPVFSTCFLELITLSCHDFFRVELGELRQNTTNRLLRSSRGIHLRSSWEIHFQSHASHMGDLGSAPVILFPIFVMLVMIMMQCNQIVVVMMFFCWFAVTECWDPMFSFRHEKRTLSEEYETPSFTYFGGSVPITLRSLAPFSSLTSSQKILIKTGCRIHHFVKQSALKCRRILKALRGTP